MNQHRFVSLAAANAVDEIINGVASGEIPQSAVMLGGPLEDLLSRSMNRFFDRYGPSIAENFSKIAEPAAEKASKIIGPIVEEKLKAQMPTFALITGVIIAGAIWVGGWQARRIVGPRRRRRVA